jgi:hypothetical protein
MSKSLSFLWIGSPLSAGAESATFSINICFLYFTTAGLFLLPSSDDYCDYSKDKQRVLTDTLLRSP